MPRYWIPLFAAAALHAGVTDFHTLSQAKTAYEQGDYAKASEQYGALHDKNDQARFNYGDALYKQKKYKEAADTFTRISDPALKQKALHNLGNSLANLGKTDDAIKAYEEALKLGEDKDTRYNLDLLKKQKQQQQQQNKDQKQNDQKQQDKKNGQNQNGQGRDQKNDQQQSGQNDKQNQNKQSDQQKGGKQKQDRQNSQHQNSGNGQGQEKKQPDQQNRSDDNDRQQDEQRQSPQEGQEQARQEQQQGQNASAGSDDARQAQEKSGEAQKPGRDAPQAEALKAAPISDMEERKYNNMLDKRGIKTLMIPLSGKGEPHEDETTPW